MTTRAFHRKRNCPHTNNIKYCNQIPANPPIKTSFPINWLQNKDSSSAFFENNQDVEPSGTNSVALDQLRSTGVDVPRRYKRSGSVGVSLLSRDPCPRWIPREWTNREIVLKISCDKVEQHPKLSGGTFELAPCLCSVSSWSWYRLLLLGAILCCALFQRWSRWSRYSPLFREKVGWLDSDDTSRRLSSHPMLGELVGN